MKKRILEIGVSLFILDQVVKIIIMSIFSYQETVFIIPKFLYFTYVKNTGGAWSILSNNTWLLLLISIICIGGLGYYIFKKNKFNYLEIIYYGLFIGGILGNLVDRLFRSGVVDYIGLIFGNYYFPVFNIADMCIVGGAVLVVLDSFRS